MFEKLKILFRKSPKEPECEHNWVMEEPDFQFGNSYKEWIGPVFDYCSKCGERRPHPECKHRYKKVRDDGSGPIVNGKRMELKAVCSKCGSKLYK